MYTSMGFDAVNNARDCRLLRRCRCRAGAEAAEGVLSKVWPNASQAPKPGAFAKAHVCGTHFKEQVSGIPWNEDGISRELLPHAVMTCFELSR